MKKNYSNRRHRTKCQNKVFRNRETPTQEFKRISSNTKQVNLGKYLGACLSITLLPLKLGRTILKHTLSLKALSFAMLLLLGLAAFKFAPTALNSNSTDSLETNAPRPIAALDLTSRLVSLNPIANAELSHKVKRGDTLSSIAQRYSLPMAEVNAAHDSIENYRRSQKIGHVLKPGKNISIVIDKLGLREILLPISTGREIKVIKKADGSFKSTMIEQPRKKSQRVAMGLIESSFADAALNSGISYTMIDELVDLFGDRVSFHRDFRKGDRFSIIYSEEQLASGEIVGGDEIIGASVEANGKTFYAIRYIGNDGKSRYFNREGELLGNAFLRYPVKFSRISSLFNKSRFHPIHKTNRPHNGVDFAAPTGTPVRSVANGRVIYAGRKGPAGIMVKIQHNDRYATAYLHLSKISKGIRRGSRVERGQVIGAVGSTGNSTGAHLHYSFYDRGRYIDPLKVDLPTLDDLKPGLSPKDGYVVRARLILDSYQKESLERIVFNQKLPEKYISLVGDSSENA